jgi:hypothetical protein
MVLSNKCHHLICIYHSHSFIDDGLEEDSFGDRLSQLIIWDSERPEYREHQWGLRRDFHEYHMKSP